jgi:hypothetical protein
MRTKLPLDGRHVADRRVQAHVVVAADPGGDGGHGVGPGGEPVAVDELTLQAGPERLGGAVVEARGHPACRLADTELVAELPVLGRQVLGRLNRSMQHRALAVSVGVR